MHLDPAKDTIEHAQVWEDADILLEALNITPEDECLSIASAGDNALAMLAKGPAKVIAIDRNPAQIACLELRVAAFKCLDHTELLELVGSIPSTRRHELYATLQGELSLPTRVFWNTHPEWIAQGIGHAGRFENYLRIFRQYILPLIQIPQNIVGLLEYRDNVSDRYAFYHSRWNNWAWRLFFRLFFSRPILEIWSSAAKTQYYHGDVAGRILSRATHAMTELDPSSNPYLQWILLGVHQTALPYYLRPENFNTIRDNLSRLEWRCTSVEEFLAHHEPRRLSKFNLSDIFESMTAESTSALLRLIAVKARDGALLAYWNTLAPRSAPGMLEDRLIPLSEQAYNLHLKDKAFFYDRFVLEQVACTT